MSDSVLMKSADVARLLQVHPKQVYRLLARGLPAHRVGSEWRFARDEVLSWSGMKLTSTLVARSHPRPPLLNGCSFDFPAISTKQAERDLPMLSADILESTRRAWQWT